MLAVQVKTEDFREKIQQLAQIEQAIRKVVIFSLSDTVDDVHRRQVFEMDRVFDRPTRYVKRGLRKRYPAGKARSGFRAPGIMEAGTYFEDFGGSMPPADVIKPHVFGGTRKVKKSERRMRGIAGLGNSYLLPGKDAAGYLDKHGNMKGSAVTQMLNKFGTIETARPGQKRRKGDTKEGVGYYKIKVPTGHVIIKRTGKRTERFMFATEKVPQYRKNVRYDYFDIGSEQVKAKFPLHVNRIMNKEIADIIR